MAEMIQTELIYLIISIGVIITIAPLLLIYLQEKEIIECDKTISYLVYAVGISILVLALFLM